MFEGETKAALRLLSSHAKGDVLHLNDIIQSSNSSPSSPQTVLDSLISKHLPGQPVIPWSIIHPSEDPTQVHPVLFDHITAVTIRNAALHTEGAAGPSGFDAAGWKRLCTSFHAKSNDLCHSLALLDRKLSTVFLDPKELSPFLACRLIAVNKSPGVRPIGICQTSRRIVAKAILSVTRQDIQQAAGSLQLRVGQVAGIDAAIHTMSHLFNDDGSEAALLVDANNAFNLLNRQAALPSLPFSSIHI